MCGKKVLQDYALLDKHMRGNHNIDVAEYRDVLANAEVLKQLGLDAHPDSQKVADDTTDNVSEISGNADLASTPTKSQEDTSIDVAPNQVIFACVSWNNYLNACSNQLVFWC